MLEPTRWALTFQSAVVPIIGFLFLPWTTIMYVLVFPGGIEGLDWLWLGIGLAVDIDVVRQQCMGQPQPGRRRT